MGGRECTGGLTSAERPTLEGKLRKGSGESGPGGTVKEEKKGTGTWRRWPGGQRVGEHKGNVWRTITDMAEPVRGTEHTGGLGQAIKVTGGGDRW